MLEPIPKTKKFPHKIREIEGRTILSFKLKVMDMMFVANALGIDTQLWKVEKTAFSTYRNKQMAPVRRDVTLHTFDNGVTLLYRGCLLWSLIGDRALVMEVLEQLKNKVPVDSRKDTKRP